MEPDQFEAGGVGPQPFFGCRFSDHRHNRGMLAFGSHLFSGALLELTYEQMKAMGAS